MKHKGFTKLVISSLLPASVLTSVMFSTTANARDHGSDIPLPPQDAMVTTIIDKSVIHGSLAHDSNGNLIYDNAGNARFQYSGKIYSVETDNTTSR